MQNENAQVQMRKGVLELCILRILSHGEAYTSDLSDRLKQAELLVVEGTLYPLLTRMKNAGWLVYRWAESKNGPPRKYYALTNEGVQQLELLDREWESFVEAVQSLNRPTMAENFDSGQPIGSKDGNPMGPKVGNPMGPKDGNSMGPKVSNPIESHAGNTIELKPGQP
jgi:PadR family transcriptional regulator PadR